MLSRHQFPNLVFLWVPLLESLLCLPSLTSVFALEVLSRSPAALLPSQDSDHPQQGFAEQVPRIWVGHDKITMDHSTDEEREAKVIYLTYKSLHICVSDMPGFSRICWVCRLEQRWWPTKVVRVVVLKPCTTGLTS